MKAWQVKWNMVWGRLGPMQQCGVVGLCLLLLCGGLYIALYEEEESFVVSRDKYNKQVVLPHLHHNRKHSLGGGRSMIKEKLCAGDAECIKFMRLLASWPQGKPKAAIYLFLTLSSFRGILRYIDRTFNWRFNYPIIFFYENHVADEIPRIRALTNSTLIFQEVVLQIPDFIQQPLEQITCVTPIQERNKLRFLLKQVYEQPVMRVLDYAWRLDELSHILAPVKYDLFKYMRDNHILYGYAATKQLGYKCTEGLPGAVDDYMGAHKLTYAFQLQEDSVFYNSFEIADMRLWYSREYGDFINYLDQLGGIYYHRWGDAQIKTMAVNLFVDRLQTKYFSDVIYHHKEYL